MKYWLLCSLLLISPLSVAQFDISGEGTVFLSNGKSQPFDFGFSYFRQDGQYRFIVGRYSLMVPSVPQKYSLALILQDDKQVWASDFINEPINGFTLELDGHELALYQDTTAIKAKGHFVLELNGERFYFDRGPAQVNFLFTEQGIKEVRVEGMFKPAK